MSEQGMKITLLASYIEAIAEHLELDIADYQNFDLLVDAIGVSIDYDKALREEVERLQERLDAETESHEILQGTLSTNVQKLTQRLADVEALLTQRDGGDHDADCKVHRNYGCNCGHDAVKALSNSDTVNVGTPGHIDHGYWNEDHRCIHCGAGDDNHHSYTCPTGMHPDKRSNSEETGK